MFPRLVCLISVCAIPATGCVVSERCFSNKDCAKDQICDERGRCTARPALPDSATPIRCPLANMVKVAEAFCIDLYEASRLDATETSAGQVETVALSVEGVLPWQVESNAAAEAACVAAGKRLCTAAEWLVACQGPDGTVYSYGDTYEETTCNGIDTFGDPTLWEFKLMPTGSFPGCTNSWGVFDINGNLWEHVAGGSDKTVRGGAFNCGDSRTLHRCDYIPGWVPSARGFRCCADGVPEGGDAGALPDLPSPPDLSPGDRTVEAALDGGLE